MLPKLSIQSQESRKYEKARSPEDGRPGTSRSASASSAAPSRGFSQREITPVQRRPTRRIEEEDEAEPADLYDMYRGGGGGARRPSRDGRRPRPQQRYMDEDDLSDYDGSLNGAEFEMIPSRRGPSSRSGSRPPSRRPDIRKVRVKVHAEDVRYIMVGTAIEYQDFIDRIKDKFGLRRRFKLKVKDDDAPDGDMITMGDQDDLDMALQSAISLAKRQRQEAAKMEVRSLQLWPALSPQNSFWA